MKIDRTKKIALAGLAVTVLMLAIVLPVALNNSERNAEINGASSSSGAVQSEENEITEEYETTTTGDAQDDAQDDPQAEQREPGSEQDIPTVTAKCPCFDLSSLERAVSDITEIERYFYHSDSSCTGEANTGIVYSALIEGRRSGDFHPRAMGYTVGDGHCRDYDIIYHLDDDQEHACRSLIEQTCTKHEGVLQPDDDGDTEPAEEVTCPCFDSDTLEQAVSDIAGDDVYIYHAESSCTGELDTGISYSAEIVGEDGKTHPQAMGYAVGEGYCREYDVMHDISEAESNMCRSLIEEKCATYEHVLSNQQGDVTPGSDATCPCFDAGKLDNAVKDITGDGDFIFDAAVTCTGEIADGIAYSRLAEGRFPVALGFYVGVGYCRESDMMRAIFQPEEDACRELVVSKCSQYSEELAAVSSN